SLRVPLLPAGGRSVYLKIKHKQSFDWPLGEAAVVLHRGADGKVAAARVVLGAAAPTPLRAPAAEAALVGLPGADEAALRGAATAAPRSAGACAPWSAPAPTGRWSTPATAARIAAATRPPSSVLS